ALGLTLLAPPATATVVGAVAMAVSPTSPVRVVPSRTAVFDTKGRRFSPDAPYASGGALVSSATAIDKTATPALYQHQRLGGTGYNFPVTQPGTYFVDMFVAETQGAQPGDRAFTVSSEGH